MAPRLVFDLLQYTLKLGRSITWLPFPPNRLQHLALVVPLGGPHAVYLRGMTGSIPELPQIFPGLKSLELMMDWDGHFVNPSRRVLTGAELAPILGPALRIFFQFSILINVLAHVRIAQKSDYDLAWSNGPVSFNGPRRASFLALWQEDLLSRAPAVSAVFMSFWRRPTMRD